MKKFNQTVKVGDLVRVIGTRRDVAIKEVSEGRRWIKLDSFEGSFQRGHVIVRRKRG